MNAIIVVRELLIVSYKRKLVSENVRHFVFLLSSGIKNFHFLPLIKNIKARVTTLSKKQANKPRRNVQIKQTKKKQTNTSKLTLLKVMTRQVFFWHSSISKKMKKTRKILYE